MYNIAHSLGTAGDDVAGVDLILPMTYLRCYFLVPLFNVCITSPLVLMHYIIITITIYIFQLRMLFYILKILIYHKCSKLVCRIITDVDCFS